MKINKLLFAIAVCAFSSLSLSSSAQARKTVFAAAVTSNASTSTTATGIAFTWSYSANVPACPSSAPVNCQSGFTLTDTTTGTVIATPATLGPTALTYSYTPAAGLYFGTHSFSIVANGFDGKGAPLVSAAITTTVDNNVSTLNGPSNLVGVIR